MNEIIRLRIEESIFVKNKLLDNVELLECLEGLSKQIVMAIREGKKIVLCGNGGSASDALHFAGEIVGRFVRERAAWPAVVLNSDVASITAIGNDYGYEEIFARQAEAHCKEGDVFIGISTSGNSKNIIRAAEMAIQKGALTAALLGNDGGAIGKIVDYPLVVPCDVTARIQESHILLIHILCELIEKELCNE